MTLEKTPVWLFRVENVNSLIPGMLDQDGREALEGKGGNGRMQNIYTLLGQIGAHSHLCRRR